jgi:hypothetical protein
MEAIQMSDENPPSPTHPGCNEHFIIVDVCEQTVAVPMIIAGVVLGFSTSTLSRLAETQALFLFSFRSKGRRTDWGRTVFLDL